MTTVFKANDDRPWKFTIGVTGKARHGKGTIADAIRVALVTIARPVQVIALADPLKDFLTLLVGRGEPFRGNDQERNAPIPELQWADLSPRIALAAIELKWVTKDNLDQHPNGRQLMQLFGTEVIRDNFIHDAWIRMARNRAAAFDGVTVVEDIRFPNEAKPGNLVHVLVKTVRPGLPELNHISERLVDDIPSEWFATVFNNDGTEQNLRARVVGWFITSAREGACADALRLQALDALTAEAQILKMGY